MVDPSPTPPPRPVLPASLAGLLADADETGLDVEQEPTRQYLVTQVTHLVIAADNQDDAIRRSKAMSRSAATMDAHRRGSATYSAVRLNDTDKPAKGNRGL